MGTDRENGKGDDMSYAEMWKYIPEEVALARAQAHMNKLRALLFAPFVALVAWLIRKGL